MKKKIVSVLLASLMVTSMLAGCGNSSGSSSSSGAGSTGGDTTSASGTEAGDTGLTAEEQEAVDEGIIQLDGTLPIIKDPAKFEEKYGKISALIVNSADRTVEVGDLAMCQKWFEDTGVEFDWQPIPQESATEKINLMLSSGQDLPGELRRQNRSGILLGLFLQHPEIDTPEGIGIRILPQIGFR